LSLIGSDSPKSLQQAARYELSHLENSRPFKAALMAVSEEIETHGVRMGWGGDNALD
jgi:hypothetical protein